MLNLFQRNDFAIRKYLISIFWALSILFGVILAFKSRNSMNPDGISYLDMGDAYLRGDWKMAVSSYWSPFYAWLLGLAMKLFKPVPYWEFPIAHLINLLIFLCSLVCFQFFISELISYNKELAVDIPNEEKSIILPEWSQLVLGYTLFIWSSLKLISISTLSPDMCVAAFVYLAYGLLVHIKRKSANWSTFIMLGVVLGLGYLSKEIMFPVSFVLLISSAFMVGNFRRAIPRVLVALFFFFLIATPFIIAISNNKGHLTFGESGELIYTQQVNGVANYYYWQGEGSTKNGIPKHPIRRISDVPLIYEFGSPIKGTYPLWYDPGYWKEGMRSYFDLKQQLRVISSNFIYYFDLFFNMLSSLSVGFFILYFMGQKRFLYIRNISKYWFLFIPAVTVLVIYSLVSVTSRYIAVFVVLLWLAIFYSIRLPKTPESRRLAAVVVSIVFLQMMAVLIYLSFVPSTCFRDLVKKKDILTHEQCWISTHLEQLGLKSGDKVALIGEGFEAYWARLARLKIVAEMPQERDIYKFCFCR